MTHDLLALAEECEKEISDINDVRKDFPAIEKSCEAIAEFFTHLAGALRAAHEELESIERRHREELVAQGRRDADNYAAVFRKKDKELRTAREAYTNIRTERDNLQLGCDRLHGELLEQADNYNSLRDRHQLHEDNFNLSAENKRLRGELEAAKRYNHLLVTGHDFQCNARDGFECDCGQFETSDSRRIQYLQDTLKVTAADSIANTVELSMVIRFWPGVTIGQNIVLREAIDQMLKEIDHEA